MGQRYKLGDIVAIPIPNGQYAYGKIYNDASIGIYDLISKQIQSVEKVITYPIKFFSGVFDTSIKDGTWAKIGSEPFEDDDCSWPPPQYIQDIIYPAKFRIYYKGEMTSATKDEIRDLEPQSLRKPEQLIVEICKRLKWK